MGRRNPIQLVGQNPKAGFTVLCDDLIRAGACDDALGSDGFVLMAFLVSWATPDGSGKRVWETSARHISEHFGWGMNRERAIKAIARAEKDHRLIVRKYVRDGQEVVRKCAYVVCAGGRRFTDRERFEYSAPVQLPSKEASDVA
ncbi:MAG TPA: hypothetical protein VHI52_01675 [Verrucomicrobiae bacterium]|nr:hypothetical protein [Verrucomicrobiae bacterium]